jgi:hypothetical protein
LHIDAPVGSAPKIDGILGANEWNDAKELDITWKELKGFIKVKHDNSFLYILVEHVSDTTKHPRGWDNGWIAFDTNSNKEDMPQSDDYLFHGNGFLSFKGDGSKWVSPSDVQDWSAVPGFSSSSYSKENHTIFEFKIPVSLFKGTERVGFYVLLQDADMHRFLDWPPESGSTSDFWPGGQGPAQGKFAPPSTWEGVQLLKKTLAEVEAEKKPQTTQQLTQTTTTEGGMNWMLILGLIVLAVAISVAVVAVRKKT